MVESTETPKLGITNLLIIAMLGIELGNVGDKMGRTKGAARYLAIMDLFDELLALSQVDFSQVTAEIKDLDDAERVQFHDALKSKFDIADDKLELVIEESILIVEDAYALVSRSIKLVKSFKEA